VIKLRTKSEVPSFADSNDMKEDQNRKNSVALMTVGQWRIQLAYVHVRGQKVRNVHACFRPHRLLHMSHVAWSACLCFGHTDEMCKDG